MFRDGDKVRCINANNTRGNGPNLVNNQIYTITVVNHQSEVSIIMDGILVSWRAHRFELADNIIKDAELPSLFNSERWN